MQSASQRTSLRSPRAKLHGRFYDIFIAHFVQGICPLSQSDLCFIFERPPNLLSWRLTSMFFHPHVDFRFPRPKRKEAHIRDQAALNSSSFFDPPRVNLMKYARVRETNYLHNQISIKFAEHCQLSQRDIFAQNNASSSLNLYRCNFL